MGRKPLRTSRHLHFPRRRTRHSRPQPSQGANLRPPLATNVSLLQRIMHPCISTWPTSTRKALLRATSTLLWLRVSQGLYRRSILRTVEVEGMILPTLELYRRDHCVSIGKHTCISVLRHTSRRWIKQFFERIAFDQSHFNVYVFYIDYAVPIVHSTLSAV